MWAALEDKSKWLTKAEEAKAKYDEDYKEWLEGGGAEALKNAKKEGKAIKGSPKKKSKPVTSSTGTGGSFKSQEFVQDSSSGSDEEKKKKKKSSDAEMASASDKGSGSGGGDSD